MHNEIRMTGYKYKNNDQTPQIMKFYVGRVSVNMCVANNERMLKK